jgi:hypothetical protein
MVLGIRPLLRIGVLEGPVRTLLHEIAHKEGGGLLTRRSPSVWPRPEKKSVVASLRRVHQDRLVLDDGVRHR